MDPDVVKRRRRAPRKPLAGGAKKAARKRAAAPVARRRGLLGRVAGWTGRMGLGAVVFVLAACAVVNLERSTSDDFAIEGIDVSYFQEAIDWPAVKADGIDFAWIKATEGGDRLDPRFAENSAGAAAAGLPRGAYHFWYHCRPGSEQAAWFIQNVPKDEGLLPPVLDMEWTPTSPTCTKRPERATIHADMKAFLDAVEAHYGRRPVIYTSVDFFQDRLIGAFEDYHLWVRSVAGHPTLRYGDRKWHFWQHTATGRVAGVKGDVDRNVFNGTRADFDRFLAGEHPP